MKHKYCMRKNFWEIIRMVQHGFTSQVVINKIHELFGNNNSITRTLREIRKKKGGHPEPEF